MGWHFDATGDHFALDSLNEGLIRHDKPLPPNMTLPTKLRAPKKHFHQLWPCISKRPRIVFNFFKDQNTEGKATDVSDRTSIDIKMIDWWYF